MADKPVLRFHVNDARLAFPNLSKGGKFGFGARLIIPPDHKQVLNPASRKFLADLKIAVPADLKAKVNTLKVFRAIAEAKAALKWGDKSKAVVKGLEAQDRLFYHNGNTKAELDGFEGNFFVACGSKGPIAIFLADTSEGTDKDAYSGCYVNGIIDVWAQDNADGGKRLNASLYGVQKVRDGDAFSAGAPAASSDEFDDISEEEGTEGEEVAEEDADLTA